MIIAKSDTFHDKIHPMRLLLYPYLFVFMTVSALVYAEANDVLVITGSVVNLRSGPGTEHPVMLKFLKGREVIEVQRQADWVEVITGRDDVASAWVHESLLVLQEQNEQATVVLSSDNETEIVEPDVTEPSPAFSAFMEKFEHYVELREQEVGVAPFTTARDMGNRVIQVTATEDWLQRERVDRETELTTIFRMWDKNEGSGGSIAIEIVDTAGEKQMYMHR